MSKNIALEVLVNAKRRLEGDIQWRLTDIRGNKEHIVNTEKEILRTEAQLHEIEEAIRTLEAAKNEQILQTA